MALKTGFSEGMVGPVVIWDDLHRRGSGFSCWELFKFLAREFPGEDVLLLEDDIIPCKNAFAAMYRTPFPTDCHMLSFFQSRLRFTDEHDGGMVDVDFLDLIAGKRGDWMPIKNGIHLWPATEPFAYSQAVKVTAAVVRAGAEGPWPYWDNDKNARSVLHPMSIRDRAIGEMAAKVCKYWGQVAPNWVEHVGDVSAVMLPEHATNRLKWVRSGNWLGYDHDALTDDVSALYYHK